MCKKEQDYEETKSRLRIWIVVAIIGVIALCGLSWWLISKNIDCATERGTFGDMFGAVNSLFSGLAFAGLIATLLYQREELKLQRQELAQTREELKGQREEFEEQNKTMKRQRFENTFFNMLSLQQEIVANLSYEYYVNPNICPPNVPAEQFYYNSPKGLLHGREVFEGMYKRAIIDYNGRRYADGLYNIFKNFGHLTYSNIKATTRFDHCGHAAILQRFSDGTLKYIEPQHDNSEGSGWEFKDLNYLANNGATSASKIHDCRGIMRIDDKLFNLDFVEIFNKQIDDE